MKGGGIGFLGVLAVVFIVLKLLGYITWSWWWVLAPVWAPWVIFVVVLLGICAWYISPLCLSRKTKGGRK